MSHTTKTLNSLIETLKDGQDGFKRASENVESHELKTLFSEYSLQRSGFSGELQALAHSLGEGEPEDSGSFSAAVHRGWMDLKATVTDLDDHAILSECERGEDVAVAAYRKATEDPELPRDVVATLITQFTAVQMAHNRVRDLRDALAVK